MSHFFYSEVTHLILPDWRKPTSGTCESELHWESLATNKTRNVWENPTKPQGQGISESGFEQDETMFFQWNGLANWKLPLIVLSCIVRGTHVSSPHRTDHVGVYLLWWKGLVTYLLLYEYQNLTYDVGEELAQYSDATYCRFQIDNFSESVEQAYCLYANGIDNHTFSHGHVVQDTTTHECRLCGVL